MEKGVSQCLSQSCIERADIPGDRQSTGENDQKIPTDFFDGKRDSLAHVMIIGQLEEELGVSIPLDEAIDLKGMRELLEKAGCE